MTGFRSAMRLAPAFLVVASVIGVVPIEADDSVTVRKLFLNPSRHYSTGPLWTWNDMLTEEHIRSTLRDLAQQRVRQVWVHPRPGLMTPYLSPDWFRLWRVALDEAKRLDMNVWIYDENSYPSGFAGGFVPEAMPEARGRGLVFREVQTPGRLDDDVLAIFRVSKDRYVNVTQQARNGDALPEARYLVAYMHRAEKSPWFGGWSYVDLLHPGVTEKFIEITFESYRRHFGEEFGKHIPGIFTDEPQLNSIGMPWTDNLPQVFQKRWGYDLIDYLPSLQLPIGPWRRVRHNYFQVLLEQFVERWGKPCYEYCQKHGLEFTGHYWDHTWPKAIGVPDNMAMYAWQQRPGIDILFNQYEEGVHSQFGNVRVCVELSSVANQLGRPRTLSETFGGSGWDMRFEDIKRQGDWEYALGVNTLNECISFVSIRGVRKGDYPQSLSYHEPWWKAYHVLANYFTRLSVALTHGEQINPTLVIEPTTTAWMYQNHEQLEPIGERFQHLVTTLSQAQVEYDIGSEHIMAEHGSVDGSVLIVGQRRYNTVVIPPLTENLNATTMDLLESYTAAGGIVLCCGQHPKRIDGQPIGGDRAASLGRSWRQVEPEALADTLLDRSTDGFAIQRDADDEGILYHHRRQLEDGDLLFLVNTSITSWSQGTVQSAARGIEQWILETGELSLYPFQTTDHGVETRFELPPCGSLLLFLSDRPRRPALNQAPKWQTIPPIGPLSAHRIGPNVLRLDYVDVAAGGDTKTNVHHRVASEFVFAAHGFKRNPWLHAVQFRDEHIRKSFPADSGFEASYRFTVEERVPRSLLVVIERPDLYKITCNGTPVTAIEGQWWLDRSFGRIDVAAIAKVGENVVHIQASPFTMYHELESAFVLGDFSLEPTDSGFSIVPAKPLELIQPDSPQDTSSDARGAATAGWDVQGHPFYAEGVAYRQDFDVKRPTGTYFVELPQWYGSVAQVTVNDQPVDYIGYQPFECDVTNQIRPGVNRVEVLVIGTLKNTLGPHHSGGERGYASPLSFIRAPATGPPPGHEYDTIGYGLFKPFVLRHRAY